MASASAPHGLVASPFAAVLAVALRSWSERCALARNASGPPEIARARPAIGSALPFGRNVTKGLMLTPACAVAVASAATTSSVAKMQDEREYRSTRELRKGMLVCSAEC